jgi:flagellar hook-associated protein 1 FlgK
VESLFNELGDEDLSTQLSTFFGAWSNLANKPQDIALRQVVLQSAGSLAGWITDLRGGLDSLHLDVDGRLRALAGDADQLAQQVADLNGQIVTAEGGAGVAGGGANGLRDKRDAVLKELSQLMDVRTVEDGGVVNVYVGSEPLVVGTSNLGVGVKESADAEGRPMLKMVFKSNNGQINVTSGQIGALVGVRDEISQVVEETDTLAKNLIFELNRIHSSGQGLEGLTNVTGAYSAEDTTAALNDPAAGLDFAAKNGSFVVHVRQKGSGLATSTLVQVDLDGFNGNDTSLDNLAAALDAVDGISASITAGKLRISADSSDTEFSFSQDTSGVLAAVGVNNFFTGSDARDIAVNAALKTKPSLLAAAKNGNAGDNQTALAIAGLESAKLAALSGNSMKETYQTMVNGVAVKAATARTNAEAAATVEETLVIQRESLSGVSLDEEAINLIRQQRAFQAASRVVAAVDELFQTILAMV